jgi:hypothetical protein
MCIDYIAKIPIKNKIIIDGKEYYYGWKIYEKSKVYKENGKRVLHNMYFFTNDIIPINKWIKRFIHFNGIEKITTSHSTIFNKEYYEAGIHVYVNRPRHKVKYPFVIRKVIFTKNSILTTGYESSKKVVVVKRMKIL